MGAEVLEALAALPGGRQLLGLGADRDDVALVGGAVRDLLLGCAPRELDVVVAGDVAPLAGELAEALGASSTVHERFGTAVVEWEAGRVDIARRRAESYAAPGALPDVRPGTVEEDLQRRDFTVNAIAVALGGSRGGELDHAEHALEDLADGRLRVLHERSFIDDPTRLLRMARYRARLGFEPEAHTAELAAAAVAGGALASVSRARLGAELRLALGEADAVAALEAMEDLGVLGAVDPRVRFDGRLARAALELLSAAEAGGGTDTRRDLLLLATLLQPMALGLEQGVEADMRTLLDDLEVPASDRDPVLGDALCADAVAEELAGAEMPSEVYEAASNVSPEGVALAGAWGDLRVQPGAAGPAAREWLAELRNVRLLISGEDLLIAGIPEGPEVGRRLRAALRRKLDDQLGSAGREAELKAALEARV
jgi:tRNA nucleotidyltransferase (CCA-adding enzyme)